MSIDEISKILYSVISDFSRAFIIVDALDECQVSSGNWRKFLTEIFNLQTKTGLNLFATSRFIPDIENEFERSLSLEIRAVDEDVKRYLDNHISKLPKCVSKSTDLQQKIKTEIVKTVKKM